MKREDDKAAATSFNDKRMGAIGLRLVAVFTTVDKRMATSRLTVKGDNGHEKTVWAASVDAKCDALMEA